MKKAAIPFVDEQRYKDEFESAAVNEKWKHAITIMRPSPKRDNVQKAYDNAKSAFVSRKVKTHLNTKIEGNYSLDINTGAGKQYYNDQNIALDYALANREAMVNAIIIDIQNQLNKPVTILEFINRNHNHAELKDGYIIHRKGATHAELGMKGVIPGNMRDGCFIVEGLGSKDSMSSSSHGAGRVLSRKKAKAQLDVDKFNNEMIGVITNHNDSMIDEAPDAYKNIFEVMDLQKELVNTVTHIIPVLNIKG